eukprot:c12266_g1_i1 orf=281-4573(+)
MATPLTWTSHATNTHPFNFGIPHGRSEKPQNCQCNQNQKNSLALLSHDQLQMFCKLGQIDGVLDAMLHADHLASVPSVDACLSLVKSCNKKTQAKRVHAYLALLGLDKIDSLSETLLVAFTKFSGLEDSLQLFQGLPHQSVVSWTAILSSCVDSRKYQKALNLYHCMQEEGIDPNSYTFVTLLKACSSLHNVDVVKELHADINKQGFGFDLFIGSTLVSIYGKCGRIIDAENVFARLPERDLVSWNAMLLAYVEQGEGEKALQLFRQLQEEGVSLSERTFVIVLQACCILEEKEGSPMPTRMMSLEIGRSLHADALRWGFSSNTHVGSTLINLYSKLGSIAEAENVFPRLLKPDTVLWNAMLLAYVQQGQAEQSLQLYIEMLARGFYPSERTFVILFQACCMLGGNEEALFVEKHWTKTLSLDIGSSLHEDACIHDFDANLYIQSILVEMYGTTGSIVDAEAVFFKYLECDSVLLNAMLSEYVECGRADDAIGLYREMLNQYTIIDEKTIIVASRALCMLAEEEEPVMGGQGRKTRSLHHGRLLHADAQKRGYDLDVFVNGALLKMYAKCGSISEAEQVFKGFSEYDMLLWTGMLSAYVDNGKEQESLFLYRQMKEEGMDLGEPTFVVMLQACSCLAKNGDAARVKRPSTIELSLEIGQALHADVRKAGLDSNDLVGNSLINFYGKCGSIGEVDNVFIGLCHHDIVLWNSLLLAYAEQGHAVKVLQLYKQMQVEGVSANEQTFVVLLKACCMLAEQEADDIWYSTECGPYKSISLSIGQALHTDACKMGFFSNVLINCMLLQLYGKCHSIQDTENVFGRLTHLDVVSYTAMLNAYVHHGEGAKALHLYRQMLEEGTSPDERALVAAFQACCTLSKVTQSSYMGLQTKDIVPLRIGQAVHVDALRKGITLNVHVRSSLFSLYSRCGDILEVENVCCSLLCSNSVSWNAMISAYIESSHAKKALQLYMHMQEEGVYPDEQTYLLVLQACCMLAEKEDVTVMWPENKMTCLEIGRALHVDANRKGLDSGQFITSALLFMYGKCGSVAEAEELFNGLTRCNTVVWNSMLCAYAEHDQCLKALELYEKLQLEGPSPDERTFVIALQACGKLAERDTGCVVDGQLKNLKFLEIGQKLHADAHRMGFDIDPFVGNALLSMYGKSRNIMEAESIFSMLPQHDIVSWNAMLSAYVGHAEEEKALKLYSQMQDEGVVFNDVTFVCILQACNESGRAEICRQVHFEIVSTMEDLSFSLATSLINAYGSCGCMAEAQATFDSVPRCGVVLWSALLAGYAQQGNSLASLHTYVEMQLRSIKPDRITFLSLLSAYSHTGLVREGVECYDSLFKDHGITPDIKHFVSLLDLLGRAGDLAKAEDLLSITTVDSNLVMWLSLLRACGKHHNMKLGKVAFDQAVRMQPEQAVAYILMSNLYADTDLGE